MVKAYKEAGIRIIVDLVPNHSSDQHPWFKEALASPRGSDARALYHFRDGMSYRGLANSQVWARTCRSPRWIGTAVLVDTLGTPLGMGNTTLVSMGHFNLISIGITPRSKKTL